jgi:hypothetical protein
MGEYFVDIEFILEWGVETIEEMFASCTPQYIGMTFSEEIQLISMYIVS